MSATIEYRRQTSIIKDSTSPVDITTNLLAYWSLEESSGTIYDQLNGVNMTPYNSPLYHQTGKINYGIDFGYSLNTGCVNTSNDEATNPNGDKYTIQAWVYLNTLPSVTGHKYTITRGSLSSTPWENITTKIDTTDNKPLMRFTGPSGDNNYAFHSTSLTINTWYHLVFIIRGIGTKPIIYVNTISTEGYTTQIGNIYDVSGTNAGFNIGNSYNGGNVNFDGILDEIVVWNRALTSDEVTWLYNSGNGRSYSEF